MRKIIFTLAFIAGVFSAGAQFTITPVKGKAGTPADDLSYPRVGANKTRVAAKIDSTLQLEILSNEKVITDPKKIFNNTVYIREPDSLAQSGHTSIDYEILLNNNRVLSIKFNLESMGAYPENYVRYFCFDAQTGDALTEKDLFTVEGLKYLQSHLRSERANRIKELLMGESPNVEDSAFARERYEECNSDAGSGHFVIREQNILFYKEYCFPHAWRPWDTDLDVPIDYQVIKKHLTSRGKKLLGL
jgi:hypothetical protein